MAFRNLLLLLIFLPLCGQAGPRCAQEGRVLTFEMSRNEAIATLENGFRALSAPRSIFNRMFEGSLKSGTPLCLSGVEGTGNDPHQGYPTQIDALIDLSGVKSSGAERNCIQRGFIRRAITNMNYDWFYLEHGFIVRVDHGSKVTPTLYEAAFSKKEICLNRMDLGGSGPTWGIPFRVDLID